jgi:hypothetical protein
MDLFTRENLKLLLAERQGPCVSLFIPTHRGGKEEDPIRWKNCLTDVEKRLETRGLRAPEARELLGPARRLVDEPIFWKNQSDGLAFFLAPGFLRLWRVSIPFKPLVVVGERFQVKPLLPLLDGDGRFFVLALSQNGVRLLQGTRQDISAVDLKDTPANLVEALQNHDRDEPLMYHTCPAGGAGSWGAIYHGQGVGIDDEKDDLLRYFQQIDRGLHPVLREERAPLVVAAVDYLLPIYRQANRYPHLLSKGLEGNPDRLSDPELHDRVWPLVEPIFRQAQEKALARYQQLAGTGRTACEVADVVPAAYQGQVETLLVALNQQRWGQFDQVSGSVISVSDRPAAEPTDENEQPGTEDLLNVAAIHTLLHGGTVHLLPAAEVPGGLLAAILRTPLFSNRSETW